MPPVVGRTRELAEEVSGGVFWVPLAPLRERRQPLPADVQAALRAALASRTRDALASAVELARVCGYS